MDKIRPPSSSITGPLGTWLNDFWRVLNTLPRISVNSFDGVPNSQVSGVVGDLLVNVSPSATSRLWIMGGNDPTMVTTQGWISFAGGGGVSIPSTGTASPAPAPAPTPAPAPVTPNAPAVYVSFDTSGNAIATLSGPDAGFVAGTWGFRSSLSTAGYPSSGSVDGAAWLSTVTGGASSAQTNMGGAYGVGAQVYLAAKEYSAQSSGQTSPMVQVTAVRDQSLPTLTLAVVRDSTTNPGAPGYYVTVTNNGSRTITVTLSVSVSGQGSVTPSTNQTISNLAPGATSAQVQYTVTQPTAGQQPALVTWTATASGYQAGVFTISVADMGQDAAQQLTVDINQDGSVTAKVSLANVHNSFKWYAVTATGALPADPTDATIAASGTIVNARSSSVTVEAAGTMKLGDGIVLGVIPYTGTSASGSAGVSLRAHAVRAGFNSISRAVIYGANGYKPADPSSESYGINYFGSGALAQVGSDLTSGQTQVVVLFPPTPNAATLTNVSLDVFNSSLGGSPSYVARVFRVPVGQNQSTAQLSFYTFSPTDWQTGSMNLNESTTNNAYTVMLSIAGGWTPGIRPDWAQTQITMTIADPSIAV